MHFLTPGWKIVSHCCDMFHGPHALPFRTFVISLQKSLTMDWIKMVCSHFIHISSIDMLSPCPSFIHRFCHHITLLTRRSHFCSVEPNTPLIFFWDSLSLCVQLFSSLIHRRLPISYQGKHEEMERDKDNRQPLWNFYLPLMLSKYLPVPPKTILFQWWGKNLTYRVQTSANK